MLRPKRSAAQKSKPKEDKGSNEDELNLSEESDDGDFSSASSDEYVPNKDNEETFDASEEDISSSESGSEEETQSEDSPVKSSR